MSVLGDALGDAILAALDGYIATLLDGAGNLTAPVNRTSAERAKANALWDFLEANWTGEGGGGGPHTHVMADITDMTAAGRNLCNDADAAAQRTTLGLGSAAVENAGAFAAASHAHAQSDVTGLTAALDAKAPLASPALTGTPTAPTAAGGTNTTQIATTAFVRAEIAATVDAAPAALDTLNELAAALGDDANFASTMTTALAGKAATSHAHAPADITFAATQRVAARNTAGGGAGEEVTASQLFDWISSTRGVLAYRGAAGWAALAPGTSGHVLTSQGAGADPVWAAPAGGDDTRLIVGALTADPGDITGITLVELAGLTKTIGVGIWIFEYFVIYQTSATGSGVEFVVDHTGTDTAFVSNARFGTTGGAAATGIADQVGTGSAAGLMEVKTQRTAGARPGVTIGVDTANADCLMIVEGVIRVSVSGDLKIFMAAELAGQVCRAKAGSAVRIVKCG